MARELLGTNESATEIQHTTEEIEGTFAVMEEAAIHIKDEEEIEWDDPIPEWEPNERQRMWQQCLRGHVTLSRLVCH